MSSSRRAPERTEEIVGAAAAQLSGSPDLAATLRGIAAAARTALGADRATFYAYDVEAQVVSAVYTTEADPQRRAFLEGTVGMAATRLPIWRLQLDQADNVLAIEDVALDPAIPPALAKRLGSGALLGVRLEHLSVRAGEAPALLGTLFCSYARPRRFSASEREAVRGLANFAAMALANARLQVETARSLEENRATAAEQAALVATIQDGLWVLSADGAVVDASERFCEMTGYRREELIGTRPPFPHWPEADLPFLQAAFAEVVAAGAKEFDLDFQRKDGTRFPVILSASPMAANGGVRGYLATVKDITERKRAEQDLRRQRDYSAALLASMQDGLTMLSPEGIITEVSPSFCQLTGFSREELIGQGCPYPYWPEAEPERLERAFRRIRETGAGEWDLEFRRKSGERFPVILGASLLRGEDGEVRGYVSTVKDVTERKRAEEEVRRGAAENRALAAEQAALRRVATQVAAEADPEAVFGQAAEEVAGLLGVECGVVVRFSDSEHGAVVGVWGAEGGPALGIGTLVPLGGESATARVFRSGQPARMRDYAGLDKETGKLLVTTPYRSGVAAPVRVGPRMWGAIGAVTSRPELLSDGCEQRLAHFAELVGVAIANAEARARLAAQAATDPLTGLANHRTFFERLHAEVERARRHGHPLALVVIDLDHFKAVNDTYGHQAGDRVLEETAGRLVSLARAEDTLARVGGEEFAWLLPESDARAAWAAAERARQAIAGTPFPAVGRVTMSGGVAELAAGASVNELFRAADAALYWAKAQGRDACVPYSPEHDKAFSARPVGAATPLAPSVARLLAMVREQLALTLAAVSEFRDGTYVVRQLDGDGEAFGVRTGQELPPETYCRRMVEGRLPNLVRDARRDERVRDLPITATAGIGAYVGVPITRPGGGHYGTLFCLSPRPEPGLGEGDVRLLRIVAAMLGEELERERRAGQARHARREGIRRVLAGEGLSVVLQPIVELDGGRVVAAEALSRFVDEPLPDAWFAEAAALGLGVELELAAIRAALAQLGALPAGVRLSLNVSPESLLVPELAELLAPVTGSRLALELTEHAPVADYAALEAALAGLRARGVQLMIDDAGAGFSSLRHVLGLRPDVIKLDLSLTRDIDSDPVRRALAASLVAFAREIGAAIVAEGIETRGELEALRSLGVTHGQGYYLARPGPEPVPVRVALTVGDLEVDPAARVVTRA
jgi:diguanylate cyclase (GGDEF)-like protein/PAS domain S-box-containing protein